MATLIRWIVATCLAVALGCSRLGFPVSVGPAGTMSLDGVTQSTPLLVGRLVDPAGKPIRGAQARLLEGFYLGLDGVTQSTPLDGITQSTPLSGPPSRSVS